MTVNHVIKQMSRITITIDDMIEAQNLTTGNEAFKEFDIVAVCPGNIDVFVYLCKHAEVDIICLDYNRKSFSLDKKTLDEALRRNICFEVCYNGLLGTSSNRRDLLNNTKTLLQYLRNRNVIVSSDAENWLHVRSPLDVANLAQCLQLNKQQAIKTITDNSVIVINHAKARKLKFLPIEIMSVTTMNKRFKLTAEMVQQNNSNDTIDDKLVKNMNKNNKNNDDDNDDNDSDNDDDNDDNDSNDKDENESKIVIDADIDDDDDDTGFISLPKIDDDDNDENDDNDDSVIKSKAAPNNKRVAADTKIHQRHNKKGKK